MKRPSLKDSTSGVSDLAYQYVTNKIFLDQYHPHCDLDN